MPLFIPIAIGAGLGALAGYGGKKGYDGVDAMQRAARMGEDAQQQHKQAIEVLEGARAQLANRLATTHELRVTIARTTLGRMVELLQALDRRGRVRTLEEFARIGVKPEQVRAFVAQYLDAGGTLMGTVAAAGAGAGAGAAATGLVSALGTAGTGAAISGLSGAAAQSALLAWLGGGSLAVGGGGMAVGTVMLGGIMVAPAIAIGGLVLAAQGESAVTKAEAYCAKVDVAIARIDALIAFHGRAEVRNGEIEYVLRGLSMRASATIETIFASVATFDYKKNADVARLSTAMLLCKALSDLLKARVLDDSGLLDGPSERLVAQYRHLADGV